MSEHSEINNNNPENIYALTKSIFSKVLEYFVFKKSKIKFYNLKLFDTYGNNDKRNKLVPVIINNYKNKKTTFINSRNLKINFSNIDEIIYIIDKVLNNKINPGTYIIKNKKDLQISKLIKKINSKLKTKIKIKYLSDKKQKIKKDLFPVIYTTEKENHIKDFFIRNLIL